jgi:hypothetical protein
MKQFTLAKKSLPHSFIHVGRFFLNLLPIAGAYFLIEFAGFLLLKPTGTSSLYFAALWSCLLASLILLLPRKVGRIVFGVSFYVLGAWTMGQCGNYQVFGKMMWLTSLFFADEGAVFLGDTLIGFPALWWISCGGLILLGALLLWKFPKTFPRLVCRLPYLAVTAAMVVSLCLMPEIVFRRDNDIWGTDSDYGQSSSYRAAYTTMYDAKSVYEICGVYHLLMRDIWMHEIFPLTPAYKTAQQQETSQIDAYFDQRGETGSNEMTGALKGKNVILVLMESMDDWMITPEDTPTLCRMMEEGINFTNLYTPGYGETRTLNSEFCMNTGIYMPTNGNYLFDYVTNSWNQSIAAQMTANGYTAEVFHYNDPNFYSRGAFEPAMGYNRYNCYADYTDDRNALLDDCLLFDISELNDLFFREGQTFNTIITRSAHLGYTYREIITGYGLKKYPEYSGKYGSEEENSARLKAKLVDDMFARLLNELEAHGTLENTVIIGVTDHYTYGYNNAEELFAHSGVDEQILLEKTPFFVWSADCPDMEVTKTLNTADIVPTALNLLGIDSPYNYLGQDAFDPNYEGYAIFPDGSWISNGIVCQIVDHQPTILRNENNKALTKEDLLQMSDFCQTYIHISNLLLSSNYYKEVR